MGDLRSKVIRLAYERPELRSELLPLLKESLAPAQCLQNAYDTYMDEHPKSKKKKSDPLFKKKCENSEEKSEGGEKSEKEEKSEGGESNIKVDMPDNVVQFPKKKEKKDEKPELTPEQVKENKAKAEKTKADNERKELLRSDKKKEDADDKAYEDKLISKYKKEFGDDDAAVAGAVNKAMKEYRNKKEKKKKRKDQGVAKTWLEDYKKFKNVTETWLNPEKNPVVNEFKKASQRIASRHQARIVARRHRG